MDIINSLKKQNAELTAENERLSELAIQTAEVNRAYQESQSRFQAIFEASRMGNKIIASDLKILQVNAALVKLLGYTAKDDIIGKLILDYSPPEEHQAWRHLQQQLWKLTAPSFSLETCLIRKDCTIVWCQVTSILFNDNNQTLGYTIIEDITGQYNLRKQKEEFISVASHELKTPVTSLKATLQLLNRMLDKEQIGSEGLRRLAGGAEKNTGKLDYLITDLLNTTRIEQGQLALNQTTFPVSEIMDSCCNHIELEGKYLLTFQGDHSIVMFADQQKVEQVLMNLVNNAMKYAPESLVITMRVERLLSGVKITVIDEGAGISQRHLSRLFERYYRVEENTHQGSGLGLGLYISAEIIRRHGGDIGVESKPGEGSAFWFTLPDQNASSLVI
ncbi:PAS domain-containing sensor histidine kinase [Mucilaginibacter aquaedulcis]|uniref:PAS domain-containing sensor histidine kinase n=1 Tax=Mucilaginibacter aquaedulcis TaxID=1187081 RepID=UPI0025B429AA|nr:ATP-binding protein [Mucilaginibacter aquaedulcis]MDN3551243.1 ATP-binding protein [Mucilaginibacter aquaedulcis]